MMNNGSVYLVSTIIHYIISLESKVELMSLYLYAKYSVIIRNMLYEMGHPQPSTIPTDK